MDGNTIENGALKRLVPVALTSNEYKLKTFQSSMNLLAHILIGFVVGACLIYSFDRGVPLGSTPTHIVLCVIGYQLLMAEAILSLSPSNTWSSHLKLVDKRRAHWILLVLGSALAIAGTVVMYKKKTVHWNTHHGQYALVSIIFTVISMVNGLTSLWAYEIRKVVPLPGKLSKLTHICFGIVAFVTSGISLAYAFDKNSVKAWAGEGMSYTLIAMTAAFTFIIIIDPVITFARK